MSQLKCLCRFVPVLISILRFQLARNFFDIVILQNALLWHKVKRNFSERLMLINRVSLFERRFIGWRDLMRKLSTSFAFPIIELSDALCCATMCPVAMNGALVAWDSSGLK